MFKHKELNIFGYKVRFSAVTQLVFITVLVGVAIWAFLFSGMPALHDPTHPIRHALAFIPCH